MRYICVIGKDLKWHKNNGMAIKNSSTEVYILSGKFAIWDGRMPNLRKKTQGNVMKKYSSKEQIIDLREVKR